MGVLQFGLVWPARLGLKIPSRELAAGEQRFTKHIREKFSKGGLRSVG
jgi:hypothetical protein